MVKVGEMAPDFVLPGYAKGEFKKYTLNDFHGKWLVLFFYPADFTFVCPTEIQGFAHEYAKFAKAGAEVLGVSVDSVYSHKAWVEQELKDVPYPLLSDANKEIIETYGIATTDDNGAKVALRGTFIIDPDGILKYALVSDNNVGRSVGETLRVLEALQTGGLCQVDWQPGTPLLNQKK